MTVAQNIRDIAQEARPIIRQSLDAAELLAALRDVAKAKGINWTQLKSLLIAEARDAEDGGDRLKNLTEKFDLALTYADMLLNKNVAEHQTIPPQSKNADSNSRLSTAHPSETNISGETWSPASDPPSTSALTNPSSATSSTVASPRAEEACGEPALDTPSSTPAGAGSTFPGDDPFNRIPAFLARAEQVLA